MGYYDGNTVTALWNYAQHFAMSDNSFGTTFGPSTPGALNLVAGQTAGATPADVANQRRRRHGRRRSEPAYDDCSSAKRHDVAMSGPERRRPAERERRQLGLVRGRLPPHGGNADGRAVCGATHGGLGGHAGRLHPAPPAVPVLRVDRQPAPPAADLDGDDRHATDHANHQYDLATSGPPPTAATCRRSASSRRPPTRTATRATPIRWTSRQFLVNTINRLERSPDLVRHRGHHQL